MRIPLPVQPQTRGALVKLGLFAALSAVMFSYVLTLVTNEPAGERRSFRADFANTSGLKPGHSVRVASVAVGKVKETELQDDGSVMVTFEVRRDISLTTATTATVRYKNLVGDRYLSLEQPDDASGSVLRPGSEIARSQTGAALSIDTLLNGFKPLFVGLTPGQVNQLSQNLLGVLQGQSGAVESLVETISALTTTLGDREQLVGSVIQNLNLALGSLGSDDALGSVIDELSAVADGLDEQAPDLTRAIARIDGLSSDASALLAKARVDVTPNLQSLRSVSETLNASSGDLQVLLDKLPTHYRTIQRTGAYGNFFNFFLCGVRIRLSPEEQVDDVLYTPWINSDMTRCQR